ncbi:MAG: DNA repair protein RecN [Clostridiales bacterium]|jgi:DNA repair protein RecN (Recombination protein N)|nr:DNA repair protein RecN [Clostridiales bacterium]
MLKRLLIRNVALIKSLELDFCARLNILSGETGAGKSIIVDSLMLLLGGKYDKTVLRYGEDSGFVEGVFDANAGAKKILEDFGYDAEDEIIVNRKFNSDGKNEIRINGRSATALMLRALTEKLVDIYGQNEYQSLAKNSEHLRILDYYVRHNTAAALKNLSAEYAKLQKINRELREVGDDKERLQNADLLSYQINEIEKARVREGEEDELVARRRVITGAERIAAALNTAKESLSYSDEINAQQLISQALDALNSVSDIGGVYKELAGRLNAVSIELDDIAAVACDELDNTEFDPRELDALESRLDVLRSLKRKYGDYAKMTRWLSEAKERLYKLETGAELYEKLQKQKRDALAAAYGLALSVSAVRKAGAAGFEKLIVRELADLGMADASFKIVFEDLPAENDCEKVLTQNGLDRVEFYLSANAGHPVKPLVKIISGGELSRFMLALKVVSSRIDDIPTMIFDEVDTGISGKIGQEVAKKLAVISRSHQVLCVTHLPQIASMADNHYLIEKSAANNETVTGVTLLDQNGVIDEISRLSGAKDISVQSHENARQMKAWSDSFKSSESSG